VIKREIYIGCDRNFIDLNNCKKCTFYCGLENNQVNCSKDSSVTQEVNYEKISNILKTKDRNEF